MIKFWSFVVGGILWLAAVEFIRGQPRCPNKWNFLLTFLGPLGCIVFCLLAALCLRR